MNFSASGGLEDFQARMQALVASRLFVPVVNGLALLVLSAGLASGTWKLMRPVQTPSTVAAAAPIVPALDIQPLLAAALFGTAERSAVSNVPISSLNLTLTGVIVAGGESYALISVNGQPQEPFAIGDEVSAGALLGSVFPDRVILMRAGVAESLLLEGLAAPLDTAPPPQASASEGDERYSEIVRNSPNQFYVPRTLINAQLKKPQELLTQALIVPNAGGGYLVREIKSGGAFEQLGLQTGDIVQSVNGQPLNTINDAMRMYQQLKFLRDVRIEVVRGGQSETLQYNIN